MDKETTTRTRTFVRGEQEREILEGMWVNGEPVSDKKLADERRKHLKEQREARKKEEKRAAKSGEPDAEEKHEFSAGMLAPFTRAQVDNYDFPALAPDTLDGTPAWRITVTPRREEEGLIKGTAWVDRETCRGLAEQYELAKKPGPVKAMDFRFEYAPIGPGCTAPRRFFMRGHGKALLIIKFRFEVEALIDSVQLNPMLPDSLFTDESD